VATDIAAALSEADVANCRFTFDRNIKRLSMEVNVSRSQWPLSKAQVYGRSPAGIVDSNPAGCLDVCCECCVLSGRGLCVGLITRPEESTDCGAFNQCDLETSRMRRPWPALGRSTTGGKNEVYTSTGFLKSA